MKIQFAEVYQAGQKYGFPSDTITQAEKDKPEYFAACAGAIFSRFVRNKTQIPYEFGQRYSIETLRHYLRGTNSSDKYKDKLCGMRQGNSGKRVTTMNISWNPPQILAKKMSDVKGYIMKLEYDTTTQAIDMQAKLDKDFVEASLKLMTDERIRNFGEELNQEAGRNVIAPQQEQAGFQTEKDVALFSKIGGILLEQEVAIKTLLDETLCASDYEGIKEKAVEDLLACGIYGTKSYLEKGCEIPKRRWVDINRAIIPYSDYNDFRDITFAAEIRQISIAELRKESNLPEAEIIKIARQYSRDEKSPNYVNDFYYQQSLGYRGDSYGMTMIDSIIVDVVDAVWIGTCSETVTKINRKKEGNLVTNKVADNYELSDYDKRQGKTVDKHSRQCVYKAKLVVGTSIVYDYGKEYNQSYRKNAQGKMEVILPYVFTKTGSVSLVESCIGYYDDIAMATFKKRNAINKIIPPPGLYLEKSAFENLEVGGKGLGIKENVGLLGETGVAIGDTQNVWGDNVVGRAAISPIPTGSHDQITIFNNEIEFNIRQIERVTGINDIFSGSTPNSETGLGVSKIAVNATTNSIYPVIRSVEVGHTHALRVEAKMWQVSSSGFEDKDRTRKPHDKALGYVYIGKDLPYRDFMIKIEAGVTEEEKLMLLQEITQLRDYRRQAGVGGIRYSDYFVLFEMIKGGNIKQARLYLSQVEEYIKKMDDHEKNQNQQFNIESQLKSAQQAAEADKETIQLEEGLKTDRELQLEQMKIQGKLLEEKVKGQEARRTAAVQNVYGWGLDKYSEKPRYN